uniref:Uncharacterized protein n=1 Tax=Panstrongylus lignarius TaxID=156445 RepID=A0A224XPP1_9HEMI
MARSLAARTSASIAASLPMSIAFFSVFSSFPSALAGSSVLAFLDGGVEEVSLDSLLVPASDPLLFVCIALLAVPELLLLLFPPPVTTSGGVDTNLSTSARPVSSSGLSHTEVRELGL